MFLLCLDYEVEIYAGPSSKLSGQLSLTVVGEYGETEGLPLEGGKYEVDKADTFKVSPINNSNRSSQTNVGSNYTTRIETSSRNHCADILNSSMSSSIYLINYTYMFINHSY